MHPDVDSILISEEQIKKRIQELAVKLDKEYEGKLPPHGFHFKGQRNVLRGPSSRDEHSRRNGFYGHLFLRLGRQILGRSQTHQRP